MLNQVVHIVTVVLTCVNAIQRRNLLLMLESFATYKCTVYAVHS
jgi:hypothetical protein